MENAELIRVRDMLTKIVNYINKNIDNEENSCLHEGNVINLSTMGNSKNKFKCFDCGENWEEEFVEERKTEFLETLGKIS